MGICRWNRVTVRVRCCLLKTSILNTVIIIYYYDLVELQIYCNKKSLNFYPKSKIFYNNKRSLVEGEYKKSIYNNQATTKNDK